ncbi:MAG: tRNA epoxyqueuosine(34) reductase QueG [Verrucomicrobia bacterium]|nr:tRNA epoxyqueuosine(34) reductase QueG [Verrucomicrobiota bacterium]
MTTTKLETIANAAGFDAVGVAPAVRAPHADTFHEWLAAGCHASMDWMARDPERRCSPELVLPGARSVIALAMNYFVPEPVPPEDSAVRGEIARYARGRDYHNFIPKRLRKFDAALVAEGGQQRCFVDSGPLLERDFAVLAGIAWHGKSTMALHPKLGTWFLLAAVITTLEIEAGTPTSDHCGKCTRCIDACPTAAIVAPHKVDARRCISYWTIEHEGPLPEWIRPLLGDRIFGCDDCLDACPWNRFASASREASFAVRPASQWPLRDYLKLDDVGFRNLFEGSPIRRAGRQGFLRNVCTALGNVGTADELPALEQCAINGDAVVAEHAAWAAAQIRLRIS